MKLKLFTLMSVALGLTRTARGGVAEGLKAIDRGDYASAFQELLPEAKAGNRHCQAVVGKMYEEGNGVARNYEEAAKWYRRAADQGTASAQVALGVFYQKGRGLTENYQEAMKWYQAAAAQGHGKAMYDIGTLYENGQGVARSLQEAARWYLRSAQQGEVVGAYEVADKYEMGQGIPQSDVEAWAWFGVAAAAGYRDAAQRRETIGRRLTVPGTQEAMRLRDQRLKK